MRDRLVKLSLAPVILSGAVALWPADAAAAASAPAEKAKICADAEKRYQKLFGKPSRDEDVTVVTMYKYTFCPPRLEVKRGATVRWVNVDKRTSHSVWFKIAGRPESERVFSEEKVEMTLDLEPGEHAYICGPHAEQEGMRGTLVVTP